MTDERRLPTEEELEKLPKKHIVAYAARCALRVRALSGGLKRRDADDRAIAAGLVYASLGHVADVDYEIDESTTVAGAASSTKAANATAFAAVFASNSATDKAANIARAAAIAANAAAAVYDPATFHAIRDFQTLSRPNPQPADVFGLMLADNLWGDDEPEWFTQWVDDGGLKRIEKQVRKLLTEREEPELPEGADGSIEIELQIPQGLSHEEIVELVKKLSLDANALHRAAGGSGLEIESLGIFEDSLVPEEVS